MILCKSKIEISCGIFCNTNSCDGNSNTIDGFSGHSDRRQLLEFIEHMSPRPKNVICHHGDYFKCNELGRTLREKFKVRTYAPQNLETVRLS